ncbi:MAG: hypothetical protein ACYS0G_09965 [Planctomycetota bacterium]|jgi:hypothetical protein
MIKKRLCTTLLGCAILGLLMSAPPTALSDGGTAAGETCEGDVDGDGVVGIRDLWIVLMNFGPCEGEGCTDDGECDDGDPCTIDVCILGVCHNFPDPDPDCGGGDAVAGETCEGDLDGDGVVGIFDLLIVLMNFGPCEGEGCQNSSECDDGDPCTFDICLFGVCHNFPIPNCE